MIGHFMIASSGSIVCLATSATSQLGEDVPPFDAEIPSRRREFARALVRILDQAGFNNLAFAIMKCANDGTDNPMQNVEMKEFVGMAKRLLKAEFPLELVGDAAKS